MHLELRALSVHYPGRPRAAVDGVSFGLAAGDIGVLIGPSGCGKTTLLRAVAGLEPASAGAILISGHDVARVAAERRQVGMVFQDHALFPHLDVERNVAFGLARTLSRGERRARVQEVLALVGLAGSESRMPHELSGGQQQRIALARALAPQPQLLLLDEPFSNLDVELRERLAHEIRAILKAARATALFVTHDQLEAFAIGDRIGVLQDGRLHQWDEAQALYHHPATRFVADFIGHGVFAPAPLLRALGARHAVDAGAQVLLRADDIVHDVDGPVKAEIVRKAFRGAEFLYTLRLASGETLLAHVPSHHAHAIGEWIGIRAQVRHVVAFPAPSVAA